MIENQDILISTPRSKLLKTLSLPDTPYKQAKSDPLHFREDSYHATYANDWMSYGIKSNPKTVRRQILTFKTSNCKESNDGDDDDDPYSSSTDSECSIFSPLDKIPRVTPSSSPDFVPKECASFVFAESNSNNVTSQIHALIKRTITSSEPLRKTKHEPCHRVQKPKKPILKLTPGCLNLMVSSTTGSLQDATIYATEINSSINAENDGKSSSSKIPILKSVWEKVMIPVNPSLKERHKRLRKDIYDDLQDDSEDDDELNEHDDDNDKEDAAVIRGYELCLADNKQSHSKEVPRTPGKRIRWASL